jgi:hypothetical protein
MCCSSTQIRGHARTRSAELTWVACGRSIPVASSVTGPARCDFLDRSHPRLGAATVRGTRVRTLEQFDCRRRIRIRGKGRDAAAEDAQPDSAPLGSGRDARDEEERESCAADKSAHCSDPLKHRGSVWSLLVTAGPSTSRHPGSRPACETLQTPIDPYAGPCSPVRVRQDQSVGSAGSASKCSNRPVIRPAVATWQARRSRSARRIPGPARR